MNINRRRQSQFELFPKASENSPETSRVVRPIKDLTLSLENIIVLCIIFVMITILFFSFGVERGKKVAIAGSGVRVGGQVQSGQPHSEKSTARSEIKTQKEERVVLPIDIPDNILDDSDPDIQPPLEKLEEQEELFTIQVASFKLEKNAIKEADRLKGTGGFDTFVVPKGSYSIVCVGKFARKAAAKKFSNKLKNRYNDCLVRRL